MFRRILKYSSANESRQKTIGQCLRLKSNVSNSALVTKSTMINAKNNLNSMQRKELIGCIKEDNKYSFKMSNVSKSDLHEFNNVYSNIMEVLTNSSMDSTSPFMSKWYRNMLVYNLPTGKKRRGLATVLSYKLLEDPLKLTEEKLKVVNIMGWCTEMLTMFFLMYDDIIDRSVMRRGAPCWYKLDGVGLTAVNDAAILENSVYVILAKYFRDHPCYVSMIELFHDVTLKTSMGQAMDYQSCRTVTSTLDNISMSRYRTITRYKTSYIAFQFPVVLAMHLTGLQDAKLQHEVEFVLQELGHCMQVKNDFLDCFGDVYTNGATLYGDIREGKCAWPAVVALQKATAAQRAVMEKCYGRQDEQSVQAVVDVYKALDMCTLYAEYEEETFNSIHNQIDQMDSRLPKNIVYNFMEMI